MTLPAKNRMRVPELTELLRHTYFDSMPKPHAPFASSRDIARTYEVSLLTADRAVKALVTEGLLYRRPGSGTYIADQTPKAYNIGFASHLIFPIAPMQRSSDQVMHYFHQAGAKVCPIAYSELCDQTLANQLLKDLDGLMLSGDFIDDRTRPVLTAFTKPVALMRYDFQSRTHFHQVIRDFTEAFDEIAQAIPRGRPIWVVSENHANGKFRRSEFMAALKRCGQDTHRVRDILLTFTPGSDVTNFRLALKLADEAHGAFVFCTSDVQSDIFLNAFIQQGLTPCQDFDWVSCDNLAKFGYGTPGLPGLTTVDGFSDEIATETAILLLNQIRNPSGCQIIARKHAKLVRRETARV